MSDPIMALQAAVVAALHDEPVIVAEATGIFDGPPFRAGHPWLGVDCGPVTDWSHKTGKGREVRIAITVHDDGETAARTHALIDAANAALGGMTQAALGAAGVQIVSLIFLRSRVIRNAGGPWLGQVEWRARLLIN